jgi:Adenylate and Guanylate cyclase catalytic domain
MVCIQVYTAFDRHIEPSGVYKLDTIGDAFVVVAGLDGYKSKVKLFKYL